MKPVLLALSLSVMCAQAGLDRYRELVQSDAKVSPAPPATGVRITYLGTNAYLLESRGSTVLVDPYFSRLSLGQLALAPSIRPVPNRLAEGFAHLPRHIDAILVTHGHVDHLLDAPPIATRTGARLFASPTSIHLARATGLPARQTTGVLPGAHVRIGTARVTAFPASHDRVFGCCVPFPGELQTTPRPPNRASQWVCGEPLSFLVEMGGKRIFIDSGGTPRVLPPANLRRVDLAILGVALGDSRDRLSPALQRLRPRLFLPSHQDNFFRPLDRGFTFNSLTDFPRVQRVAATGKTRLILLDYFTPWTLR